MRGVGDPFCLLRILGSGPEAGLAGKGYCEKSQVQELTGGTKKQATAENLFPLPRGDKHGLKNTLVNKEVTFQNI